MTCRPDLAPDPMTNDDDQTTPRRDMPGHIDTDLTRVLDTIKPGDIVTVVRTNGGGGLTSTVSGPAIAAPDLDPAIGIDLLDGEPHIIRRPNGEVFGQVASVIVWRGQGPAAALVGRYTASETLIVEGA